MKTPNPTIHLGHALASLALAALLPCAGSCQILNGNMAGMTYNALNASPAMEMVGLQVNDASNGLDISGSYELSPNINEEMLHNALTLAADKNVNLTYGVPDRVMADRILLVFALQREMAGQVAYQQQLADLYGDHPYIRDQLIQLAQDRINDLQSVWDQLSSSCLPVDFRNYSTLVHADIQYKDLLTGVGLILAVDGDANLTNVPIWEIEGPVRATELIYRK